MKTISDGVKKYQSKLQIVEAIKKKKGNDEDILKFLGGEPTFINTSCVENGDYIVKRSSGRFQCFPGVVFKSRYEEI